MDTQGPEFVFKALSKGHLLDYQDEKGGIVSNRGFFKAPVVSIATMLGVVLTFARCYSGVPKESQNQNPPNVKKDLCYAHFERDVWVTCCFAIWLVMFSGRGEYVNMA